MTLFIRVGGINLDKIEKQKKKFDHLILFSEHCCRDLVLSTKDLACGCVNLEESLHHWIALWFAEISVFKTVVRLGRNFFPFFFNNLKAKNYSLFALMTLLLNKTRTEKANCQKKYCYISWNYENCEHIFLFSLFMV